ncbi:hypothetical protein NC651_004333 [Populus alba x Populus x berolinensis]|nr:hypothetical protein NC651_004333 [Populus alba x Populus x berolinensis]
MEQTQQRINLRQLKSVMTMSIYAMSKKIYVLFHKAKIEIRFLFFSKPIKRISLVKDSIPPNTLKKNIEIMFLLLLRQ